MVFWLRTIGANDPRRLARLWEKALGDQPTPPDEPATTWYDQYRARLAGEAAFTDRLFDPAGLRPPIWFPQVPEPKTVGTPRSTGSPAWAPPSSARPPRGSASTGGELCIGAA